MRGRAEPLTCELIDEAEPALRRAKRRKDLKWLGPVVAVADFFVGSLSKMQRSEPEHVGIYDRRYVEKLKSKVFGKGQSESGKVKGPDINVPTLGEVQQTALKADATLQELLKKREELKKEIGQYTAQIKNRRAKIRREVKKEGKYRLDERLFHSALFHATEMGEIRKVEKGVLERIFRKLTGFHRTNDRVDRTHLKMEVQRVTYTVETVTDPETGKSIRASMDDVGPPDSNLTWSALATILKLHIEFVIPMNRIQAMIGDKYFSVVNQCRWILETATIFLPIYIELFEQLVESPLLQGDDTNTKVLDINPSKNDDALHKKIEEELQFTFDCKNGQGQKSKLNVTFLTGKVGSDRRGIIRFYRTHQGSFGNLLSEMLSRRSPKNKDLIIQGDMSTTNLPDGKYFKKFNIKIAGCGSHARRPYWEEKNQIDAAYFFLRAFNLLSFIEEDFGQYRFEDEEAKNKRTKYSRWVWAILHRASRTVIDQKHTSAGVLTRYTPVYWPKDSKFSLACQYIINHYSELTLYLSHPELDWTNNLSERAHRKEKLMMNSSFFRKSRDGRAAIDILKTVMTTAQAAEINFQDYLQWVILNKEDVKANPHLYTPLAFAQKSATTPIPAEHTAIA